jgi:glutathione synthase/RimK-type ligase-like ATP-grasp enzyme
MSQPGRRIAIATCAGLAELKTGDRVLAEALARRGIEAPSLRWDDPEANWAGFDACLIRSTWDYHQKYEQFLAWTAEVAAATRLWNPPELVAWNSNKGYLRELERAGVPIVPTAWLQPGDEADIGALLEARGWEELIVKPVVDLGARNLKRVNGSSAKAARAVAKVLSGGEAMLQPFLPSVETEGELSLVYIEGAFTHAVRKRPAYGDFRVQGSWGGTAEAEEPGTIEMEIAALALDQLPDPPLYARVDLVRDLNDEPCLIELELIEPNLYLAESPTTADILAQAVADRLSP